MDAEPSSRTKLAERLRHELFQYAVISLYLYVCFGAILLYKAAVLRFHGVDYYPYGLAVIKALVLGKFMAIGHALRIGERREYRWPITALLSKLGIFLLGLLILSVAEEIITGIIHGETALEAANDFAGGSWLQVVAICLLMALVLLPYFAFRQVGAALGEGELRRILVGGR